MHSKQPLLCELFMFSICSPIVDYSMCLYNETFAFVTKWKIRFAESKSKMKQMEFPIAKWERERENQHGNEHHWTNITIAHGYFFYLFKLQTELYDSNWTVERWTGKIEKIITKQKTILYTVQCAPFFISLAYLAFDGGLYWVWGAIIFIWSMVNESLFYI